MRKDGFDDLKQLVEGQKVTRVRYCSEDQWSINPSYLWCSMEFDGVQLMPEQNCILLKGVGNNMLISAIKNLALRPVESGVGTVLDVCTGVPCNKKSDTHHIFLLE